jgi:hypothetical protein
MAVGTAGHLQAGIDPLHRRQSELRSGRLDAARLARVGVIEVRVFVASESALRASPLRNLGVDLAPLVTVRTIPAEPRRKVAASSEPSWGSPTVDRKPNGRKREPSRLALQLAEAFAPCAEWSQVRVQRGAGGRRTRVIVAGNGDGAAAGAPAPFDWATGTL